MFTKFKKRQHLHHSPTAKLTSLPADVSAYSFCLSVLRAQPSADDLKMPDNHLEYLHELKFDQN